MAEDSKVEVNATAAEAGYEKPAIEQVITPETLEREVAYAGIGGPSQQIN
jgi:hypothetical protein